MRKAKSLVYICDWLPPDFGAVGQYSLAFSEQHAAEGADVVLIGLSSSGASEEVRAVGAGTLRIVRIAARTYDKTRSSTRLAWTVRINLGLIVRALPFMRRSDEVKFTGSPPLFLHVIAPLNLCLRRRLVYRITDFHPECAIAERGRAGPALTMLLALTRFWRRRVHAFEALGHDQKRHLVAMGIAEETIVLKRDPSPVEIKPDTPPLPRPAGGEGRVLLLYSGNWGVAHDVETFLAAYRHHHREGSGRVVLWLNAVGSKAEALRRVLRDEALDFVDGRPVPLAELANLLVTPDAHLITLQDAFVGYVLPSKVYGCAASGRPVLFVGSVASDVHLVCEETCIEGYRRVDVGDATGLASALEALADRVQLARAPRQGRRTMAESG